MLERAAGEEKDIVLMGDFNLNLSAPLHQANSLLHITGNNNLKQLISEPTRISDHSQSLIDLLFVSSTDFISSSGVVPLTGSDHLIIFAECTESMRVQPKVSLVCWCRYPAGRFGAGPLACDAEVWLYWQYVELLERPSLLKGMLHYWKWELGTDGRKWNGWIVRFIVLCGQGTTSERSIGGLKLWRIGTDTNNYKMRCANGFAEPRLTTTAEFVQISQEAQFCPWKKLQKFSHLNRVDVWLQFSEITEDTVLGLLNTLDERRLAQIKSQPNFYAQLLLQ